VSTVSVIPPELTMLRDPQFHPLHRFRLVCSENPDELSNSLVKMLNARDIDFGGDMEHFHSISAFLPLRHLDLIYSACTVPISMRLPETNKVKQKIALHGTARASFADTRIKFDIGETGVIPAGAEVLYENGAGLEQFVIRIDAAALQSKLGAMVGGAIVKNIAFETRSSSASPQWLRLRRLIEFIVAELDRDDAPVPPQTLEEYEQLLLVCFLTANRHNLTHLLERGPRPPAPWQVRLVEEYIEANWNKPITIEALAAVTGGSARSIFKAFKETRGVTPMAFVKTVRLDHAKRLLQAAEANTSVIGVAFACGFLNSGHFARDYRLAYGELPSATLTKARQRRS
jgi:AraC-like DNA-binding protein